MLRGEACAGIRRLRALSGHLRSAATAAGGGSYDYDLIVIGGGSGGLACSKEAASFGKRVAVLDFVAPSPQGTSWGLGGTCVNVGCIPKKLMHQAALLGQATRVSLHCGVQCCSLSVCSRDAQSYGWMIPDPVSHSWETLVAAVKNHIKSLNWGHRVQLKEKNVDYFNAHGSFLDAHTIEVLSKEGNKTKLTSQYFVLAVGGRPKYPNDVPGAREYGISSDDIFFLQSAPGKTLVIGASYVALECAGFLAGLGMPTSLMVRSRPLKSFDQELASMVLRNLERHGVHLMHQCEPVAVEKGVGGELTVTWHDADQQQNCKAEWDTVLFATGREASTRTLNLHQAGVQVDEGTGKVEVDPRETTTAPNIFAIGDAMNGRWELTPVAVKAGKLLARQLFGRAEEVMDYNLVPTTVFTPLEFAAIGLSEERAIHNHGEENVEVYHAYYKPLEYYLPGRDASECYIKMVCTTYYGRKRVLGLHLTGPNAGEMMQGFAVAIRSGATGDDIMSAVGIHPTCAEEVVKLRVTKRSGEDPTVTSC